MEHAILITTPNIADGTEVRPAIQRMCHLRPRGRRCSNPNFLRLVSVRGPASLRLNYDWVHYKTDTNKLPGPPFVPIE